MNHLLTLNFRAKQYALSPTLAAQQALLASDEFAAFSALNRPEHHAARVRATLFMLNNVALDPDLLQTTRELLEEGTVSVYYAGHCNPVPTFYVPKTHPDLKLIQDAFEAAVLSRRMYAARRCKYWAEFIASFSRQPGVSAVMERFRASLPWSTPDDYKKNRVAAQENDELQQQRIRVKAESLRQRRFARVHRVERALCPHASWYELLEALAAEALLPEMERLAA